MKSSNINSASSLYSAGVQEGWLAVNESCGVVLADDVFPIENATMLSSWRNALLPNTSNAPSTSCLLLAATPLVANLLEQHNSEQCDLIYLGRRRGSQNAIPIFANAQNAIDFYSEPTNSAQMPMQFVLRQERTLGLLHASPSLLRDMARNVDARMFRFLAGCMGQDSTAPAPAPRPMPTMPSHIGGFGDGMSTPASVFTQLSMQPMQRCFVSSTPEMETPSIQYTQSAGVQMLHHAIRVLLSGTHTAEVACELKRSATSALLLRYAFA